MSNPRQGFPASSRIRKRANYLQCYESGEKFQSRHFIIYTLYMPGQERRFGMAVSKKVGNAVVRNRLKRILREVFRLSPHDKCGMQVVAVARRNAAGITFRQAQTELTPFITPKQ